MQVFHHRLVPMILALGVAGTTGLQGEDATVLYGKRCALCHGKDGSGDTPSGRALKARDLRSAEVQKLSDQELGAVISNGKPGKMPSFKQSISPTENAGLVAHIRTLKKP